MGLAAPTSYICRFGLSRVVVLTCLTAQVTLASQDRPATAVNDSKNLARLNCGAQISWISPLAGGNGRVGNDHKRAASDLLLDDNTLNCQLTTGKHGFIISLPTTSNLARFAFLNEQSKIAGAVRLFVSNYRLAPNDRRWIPIGQALTFQNQRFVSLALPATEAKYVKVLFNVKNAGTIAGLALYGQPTLSSFADQHSQAISAASQIALGAATDPHTENLNFNLANLYARATVVAVSSGSTDSARKMIDDDITTAFEFAPDDVHPTVIVKLASTERLRRVSTICETQPGSVALYLLNHLPDAGTIETLKPELVLTDQTGNGKAVAEFDPRGAQYVALRWTISRNVKPNHRFAVAEIGAFGDTIPQLIESQRIPHQFAQSNLAKSLPLAPPVVVPASQ